MDKIILGIDLDGVIIDHALTKIRLASEHGLELTPEDTSSERMREIMGEEQAEELFQEIYQNLDISLTSPLMEGAKEGIKKIREAGISYFIISRRKKPEIAREVLQHHGLWPDFFNDENSFFTLEPEEKDAKTEELAITHFVDDEMRVLIALGHVEHRFLFGSPPVTSSEGVIHVASWEEFLNYIL